MIDLKIKMLSFLILLFVSSCSSIPGIKEPTDSEINSQAAKAYMEVKKKSKLSTNKRLTAMVKRVSSRIAKASGEDFDWEVILIESKEVNAWCMPGGKMAVYTGILPVLQNEGALAAVMGHEVAHATLRHGKEGYARAVKTKLTGLLVGGAVFVGGQLLCKTEKCKKISSYGAAASAVAAEFFNRKFSRGDETESDKVGQIYMAKAGYDPREAPKVWERVKKAGGQAPPEIMSTHPASERRQKNLTNWLDKTLPIYQSAKVKFGTGQRI
jgi:predicted Zn-dependent protease